MAAFNTGSLLVSRGVYPNSLDVVEVASNGSIIQEIVTTGMSYGNTQGQILGVFSDIGICIWGDFPSRPIWALGADGVTETLIFASNAAALTESSYSTPELQAMRVVSDSLFVFDSNGSDDSQVEVLEYNSSGSLLNSFHFDIGLNRHSINSRLAIDPAKNNAYVMLEDDDGNLIYTELNFSSETVRELVTHPGDTTIIGDHIESPTNGQMWVARGVATIGDFIVDGSPGSITRLHRNCTDFYYHVDVWDTTGPSLLKTYVVSDIFPFDIPFVASDQFGSIDFPPFSYTTVFSTIAMYQGFMGFDANYGYGLLNNYIFTDTTPPGDPTTRTYENLHIAIIRYSLDSDSVESLYDEFITDPVGFTEAYMAVFGAGFRRRQRTWGQIIG